MVLLVPQRRRLHGFWHWRRGWWRWRRGRWWRGWRGWYRHRWVRRGKQQHIDWRRAIQWSQRRIRMRIRRLRWDAGGICLPSRRVRPHYLEHTLGLSCYLVGLANPRGRCSNGSGGRGSIRRHSPLRTHAKGRCPASSLQRRRSGETVREGFSRLPQAQKPCRQIALLRVSPQSEDPKRARVGSSSTSHNMVN